MAEAPVFVDTNVFVYSFSADEPLKRARAIDALEAIRPRAVVSTQVLLELLSVCTRKLGMSREAARTAVEMVAKLPVVTTDKDLVLEAALLSERSQISIFDAMVVRAAARAGCEEILSEDLGDGQVLDGVTVRDPFATPA